MIKPLTIVFLMGSILLSSPALSYDLKDIFFNHDDEIVGDIVPIDRASTSIEPGF